MNDRGSFIPKPASSGGLLLILGRRMKTTTQSGQAWRGYERALHQKIYN
nr:MAG TPA: hypothetical protein [Caudoviricetes sp.]